MYKSYFGFAETPFAITPDSRFLYMSPRHGDALAHLKYGLFESNGFVLLTGEVGTGKTVLCRCVLEQLPDDIDAALILNPRQSAFELVANICDELHVKYPQDTTSIKVLIDLLNQQLLENHAQARRTVLIIDEAQNLSDDVLEQVRLLTNLETSKHKLLQILLIGQPELKDMLARPELRQLTQRITARYHITPLTQLETAAYIQHRLAVAGVQRPLFTKEAVNKIYRLSHGTPRLINIICDRALLGAYAENKAIVGPGIVGQAANEVLAENRNSSYGPIAALLIAGALLGAIGVSAITMHPWRDNQTANNTRSIAALNKTVKQQDDNKADAPDAVQKKAVTSAIEPLPVASEAAAAKPAAFVLPADEYLSDAMPAMAEEASAAAEVSVETEAALDVPNEEIAAKNNLIELLNDPACSSGADTAASALFELWGKSYQAQPGRTVCGVAEQEGLRCLHGTGTWNNLRRYDRPAIIEMQGPDGNWQHLLVSEIEENTVLLSCAGKRHIVSIGKADRHWFGEYLLLWKPLGNQRRLSLGNRGRGVKLLRENLEKVFEIVPPQDAIRRSVFDEALKDLVARFQRAHSLKSDGIAGKDTVILLNTLAGDPMVPRLQRTTQ